MTTTKKIKITTEEFTKALEDAVTLMGEGFVYVSYPYDMCQYEIDGEPSCLLGHALWNLGIPMPEVNINIFDLFTLYYDAPSSLSLAAREAQRDQDRGETWGAALSSFKYILAHPDDAYGS